MAKYKSLTVKVEAKSLDKLVFRILLLLLLMNQKSGDENNNTLHQEPHFIQNQKLTLQTLKLQTYGFAPLTRWCHDLQKGVLCSNSMMTSQVLKSVNFTRTQKSRYLENETLFFLQIKKPINYSSRVTSVLL